MDDYQFRSLELKNKGYCCSQILVQLSLDLIEKNNEELVKSMKGLCNGLFSGELCGCLSAGAVTLSLLLAEEDVPEAVHELTNLFRNNYGKFKCSELLEGKSKSEVCQQILFQTYDWIREIYFELADEV
ncbi:MAG: C-GCAxxG-C-C family (seleno)protein [Bacillota bacterium]|nr:C_GCAxxG_C_C family protein [Clostridia bacterium]